MNTKVDAELMIFAYVDQIMVGAKHYRLRTGQYLFNHLPAEAANAVASTPFDPFHKDLSQQEILDWINDHFIFDGPAIIGVFSRNQILWEKR